MAEKVSDVNISVNWRGKEFRVEMSADSILGELGVELQRLTSVKPDTMKLMVPQLDGKGSKLFHPFSVEHSSISLKVMNLQEGKPIKMLGVFDDEIDEVSNEGKADLRILGFEEEDERLKARSYSGPAASLRLPPGPYTFHSFRTLEIPGIMLHPPAAESLKRMHMLASDPGIVAIMNKHRWQVGIMTEMAPVGYVGISPKCVLGFNKNHGEEISLRLRTDDLKGFRKYESIKKTLLHELAHMVYSEHDANFFALDRQLNEEAANLDWTKSRSYTLSGRKQQVHDIDEYPVVAAASGHKLGGNSRALLTNPRISSAFAAHNRLLGSFSSNVKEPEPDSHDASQDMIVELNSKEDEKDISGTMIPYGKSDSPACGSGMKLEPMTLTESNLHNSGSSIKDADMLEPDPDDLQSKIDIKLITRNDTFAEQSETREDDFTEAENVFKTDTQAAPIMSDDLSSNGQVTDGDGSCQQKSHTQRQALDGEDHELQRITEPASLICSRLQHAIESLRSEVTPAQVAFVLQTLSKIIRNVIEHPGDMKFRKLRKANPVFHKNVASYRAAMEVLSVVGFQEDLVLNENGVGEAFVVLKRNDPGLLWLAKSSLEMCTA